LISTNHASVGVASPNFDIVTIQDNEIRNQAPTDVVFSNLAVNENAAGAVIGNVTVTDPDVGQSHTFELSDDRFEIVAGQLRLRSGVRLDFESSASVPLEITVADSGSPPLTLSQPKKVVVVVNDINDPPATISITGSSSKERISGAMVGVLSATDQDTGQTHTFSVASPFEISGTSLKLKSDHFLKVLTDSNKVQACAIVSGISTCQDLSQSTTITVEVTSTDSGTPPMNLTQSLVVTVTVDSAPWQFGPNNPEKFDTNGSGTVEPLDVNRVITQLNDPTILRPGNLLPDSRPANSELPFYDVDGNGFCTPLDALIIINFLNERLGEGEGVSALTPWVISAAATSLSSNGESTEPFSSHSRLVSLDASTLQDCSVSPSQDPVNRRASNAPIVGSERRDLLDEVLHELEDFLDDLATDVCGTK
jgi:hypothetical protein